MKNIAFIGVGNMASAILQGIISENSTINILPNTITLFDINTEKTSQYQTKCHIANSIPEAVASSGYIILSVKPQQYADVLLDIKKSEISLKDKIFISLAAGIDTSTIEKALGGQVAVVRTMPNTPLLIGEGMTAICKNNFVPDKAFTEICSIFASRGRVTVIDEDNMNRIIAVSSSAIACFYRMIRSLAPNEQSPAALPGLDQKTLIMCAAQACLGSAKMVLENKDIPINDLIQMVTSYKGTTEQMMITMDNEDFDGMMTRAMQACTNRANELGAALKQEIGERL